MSSLRAIRLVDLQTVQLHTSLRAHRVIARKTCSWPRLVFRAAFIEGEKKGDIQRLENAAMIALRYFPCVKNTCFSLPQS
jgi:hypothetical protein